jgi:3-dehydroquinate synthase
MRNVQVPLGERSYKIKIGPGLLQRLGSDCRALRLGTRCAIVTDTNVGPRYAAKVARVLAASGFEAVPITVAAGEQSKSLQHVEHCLNELARNRLERKSFIVALGGGVIGDLAGFVASAWLRGVPFVQVPTTLLAQVDSSVGGKTGVNLKAGKNLVGAFYQPKLVVCDLDALRTLPEREYRSGLAEVIKYGVIYDAPLFKFLEKSIELLIRRDAAVLEKVVARCCAIKAEVVGQDESESGLRAILNFGHTIGHAIEATAGYGKYLHGEAISIGQVMAARLSVALKGLPSADANRIEALFIRSGLPAAMRINDARRRELLAAMRLDKKVSGGQVKFVLARAIGRVEFGCAVPEQELRRVLADCRRLSKTVKRPGQNQ